MKPTNQPPTRVKWFTAGVLTMISDITGTLAQFMPMKAVFILAADDIPSFFPAILVNAGPILTGLALVLAAAVLAVVSTFTKRIALTHSGPNQPYPRLQDTSSSSSQSPESHAPITVQEFAAAVLIAVLLTGSAVVSLTFALSIITWIAGSAIVLAIKIHRGSRRPPFPNGRVEFVAGFKKWMNDSSLWAVVGAAIFTLVVDFPPLGLTGILLGAVLLRRMQQAVPDIVPLLVARFTPEAAQTGVAATLSSPAQAPYDFLATPVGNRLLTKSLNEMGLDSDSWQVVGRPDNVQISLISSDLSTGEAVVLRIFASGQERSLEHELALRTELQEPALFHHQSVSVTRIAGLPSIVLGYDKHQAVGAQTAAGRSSAAKWQLKWERKCLGSKSLQTDLRRYIVADPNKFLLPLLINASGINGAHRPATERIIGNMGDIRELFMNGPRVIHFGGSVEPSNLISLNGEAFEPLNVRGWGVTLIGDNWADSEYFLEIFEDYVRTKKIPRNLLRATAIRCRIRSLERSLRRRDHRLIAEQALLLSTLVDQEKNGFQ